MLCSEAAFTHKGEVMATMQDELRSLARIKERIDSLSKDKAEVEARLIDAMVQKGQKSVTSGDLKGTLVEGTRITIDEDALKKALSAAQWKKVTKQVLDKERLEAHIVTGDVDANVVAAASTEKDVKPYVKVSGKIGPVAGKKVVRPAKPKA